VLRPFGHRTIVEVGEEQGMRVDHSNGPGKKSFSNVIFETLSRNFSTTCEIVTNSTVEPLLCHNLALPICNDEPTRRLNFPV
jgi:hypothetical protein